MYVASNMRYARTCLFQGTRLEWNNVFYLTSGVCLFGTIFYLIFASADLQEWARPKWDKELEYEESV